MSTPPLYALPFALIVGFPATAAAPAKASAPQPPDVQLDETFEQPDKWEGVETDAARQATARVTLRVDTRHTHHTPRALLLAWNKDHGDLRGRGIHNTPIAPMCAVKFPDNVDLSQYTYLKFWAKIDGTRHGALS